MIAQGESDDSNTRFVCPDLICQAGVLFQVRGFLLWSAILLDVRKKDTTPLKLLLKIFVA